MWTMPKFSSKLNRLFPYSFRLWRYVGAEDLRSLMQETTNGTKGWGYSVSTLDAFLLKLFDKYAELLKRMFSEDFQEVRSRREILSLPPANAPPQIVFTDDYMPMAINSLQEYEKVVNVSWFSHGKATQELT